MIGQQWQIPVFSKEEGERRHRKIREGMASRGIDCLIISGHLGMYRSQAADLRYVCNYCTWGDGEHVVFPLKGEPVRFTWSTSKEFWAKKVSWIPVKISAKTKEGRDYAGDISAKIKELGLERGTLGIVNTHNMPVDLYLKLRENLPHAKFESARDILIECRIIRSAEELEFVRKSGECGDRAIEAIVRTARPGVDDYALTAECEAAMIRSGGESGNFMLIDSGPWAERRISMREGGTYRKLQQGDIILTELTPNYGGYTVQVLRPISLGKPPDDFMRLYDLHCELYEIVRRELRPGNTKDAITAQLGEFASKKGDFSWVWALQDVDMSEVSRGVLPGEGELKPGMVITNHPSTTYRSGQGHSGHLFGDSYIITEGEPECTSKLPHQVFVV
jgi:Xaa-Pro aminopeptidase